MALKNFGSTPYGVYTMRAVERPRFIDSSQYILHHGAGYTRLLSIGRRLVGEQIFDCGNGFYMAFFFSIFSCQTTTLMGLVCSFYQRSLSFFFFFVFVIFVAILVFYTCFRCSIVFFHFCRRVDDPQFFSRLTAIIHLHLTHTQHAHGSMVVFYLYPGSRGESWGHRKTKLTVL